MKSWRKAIVGTDATMDEAIAAIESGSIQVALVLDAQNRLLGIVTDGDVGAACCAASRYQRTCHRRHEPYAGVGFGEVVARGAAAPDAAEIHQAASAARCERPVGRGRDLRRIAGNARIIKIPFLIMAGGLGERLGALTREVPKPMLHVGGRPLLETIVRNVVQQGFKNIFISVNYRAELIEKHFRRRRRLRRRHPVSARDRAARHRRCARPVPLAAGSAGGGHQRRYPHHHQLRRAARLP